MLPLTVYAVALSGALEETPPPQVSVLSTELPTERLLVESWPLKQLRVTHDDTGSSEELPAAWMATARREILSGKDFAPRSRIRLASLPRFPGLTVVCRKHFEERVLFFPVYKTLGICR
ncbi:hypothetical protein HPB47_018755 [Ixodes persulcatus]|uniref:Uncharacterized protein n=1 Tax=Ixodes persulcatus TaxID=34615 RepID=A0AC60QKS3_IXOPE|nr:hypothetical protein HPB47_018755 [Ixodes persulcatus]